VIFGIFNQDGAVGGCGLHRQRGSALLELGCWVDQDDLREGFATEAARGLTGAAFSVPGINQVEIHHDRANFRSRGVPVKLGFELVRECSDGLTASAEGGVDCTWMMARERWQDI
jgi:ribosomal-protein-serine acetyltransferase